MKKIKELHNIDNIVTELTDNFAIKMAIQSKKIKTEVAKIIAEEKIKLLVTICNDYNLNFDEIKEKYLKPKELNQISIETTEILTEDPNEMLLDKEIIDGVDYFYEKKEKGNIYDSKLNIVGIYKNDQLIFD